MRPILAALAVMLAGCADPGPAADVAHQGAETAAHVEPMTSPPSTQSSDPTANPQVGAETQTEESTPTESTGSQREPPPEPAKELEETDETPPPPPPPRLYVHYVDVGQGDGTVWQIPGGDIVVYDCGLSDGSVRDYIQTTLNRKPGSEILALIASHGHFDHIGGCEAILETFDVQHVYEVWYEGADATDAYDDFKAAVAAEGAVVHVLEGTDELDAEVPFKAGDLLPLPASSGVRAEILWPKKMPTGWGSIAQGSIVVRLSYGTVDYCFQGDIERREEQQLALQRDVDCEIYLAGHHGSKEASDPGWLSELDPEIAVVSYGRNSYGHPTQEAMCSIAAAGAKTYPTRELGSILVSTDGSSLFVWPDKPVDLCDL